jgi:signal transduction histidine kinase
VASLFVIQGRDQGTRFHMEEPVITIGRTQNNTVRLHDTEVSRFHAELIRRGKQYVLRDLNSSNGTFVNGIQLPGPDQGNQKHGEDRELTSGDQLRFGRSLLLYTGFSEGILEDVADQIDIVPKMATDRGSRIVASLSHDQGSEWMLPEAGDSSSPWLARARSNLQIMYRTALAVSHTMDIDQLLARIMDMIFDWVDADRGCILLKDVHSDQLVPKVRRHRRGVRSDEKITISKTILDYVVDRSEGVLTSDAKDDERWDPAKSIVKMGVREAICVPMQGRYHVVGIIYIDTTTTPQRMLLGQLSSKGVSANQFTEDHLKLMIAIAHQAALAIEDTSYYTALVQAERLAAVGQTIASLSHHIKNILQGVRGGSYLIEMGLGDHALALETEMTKEEKADIDKAARQKAIATIRKGWGIVERNQERISTLVMDMLTYSKEREPEPEPANLNEVANEVIELIGPYAQQQGVTIDWQPTQTMPTMLFDPEAMHRAILNVITNAIDACDQIESGRVTVRSRIDSTQNLAQVVIEDNGVGIPEDELENIFAVFISHKGGRGTGLGLPVSRKILEEHGGQIHVSSTPDQGSRFILELPFAAAVPEAEQRATQQFQAVDQPEEG